MNEENKETLEQAAIRIIQKERGQPFGIEQVDKQSILNIDISKLLNK